MKNHNTELFIKLKSNFNTHHENTMNTSICKQYSIFLENRVGALAEVCRLIADKKINLHAICAIDTIEESILRIVPEKGDETAALLKSAGFRVIESEVILVELENRPGATGDMANILSNAGINISYVYASADTHCKKSTLILRVTMMDEALKVLRED